MGARRVGLVLIVLAAMCALVAATAGAAGRTAVIKSKGGDRWVRNRKDPPNFIVMNDLRWAPGAITVRSGQKLRLVDADRTGEPHVLAIARKKDLPGLGSNPGANRVLRMIAPALLVDPNNPQSGFKAYKVNAGRAGLNQEGDALVVLPGGPHKAITWFVSAKPGTTLHYFCAVHFWMRGVIHVVK